MKQVLVLMLAITTIVSCKKDSDEDPLVLPTAEQYLTWQIGTTKGEFLVNADTITAARTNNLTEILAHSPSNGNSVSMLFTSERTPGTYTTNFTMTINNETYLPSNEPVRVTVTQYESISGYIVGSYQGELRDDEFKRYGIRGYFKIRTR